MSVTLLPAVNSKARTDDTVDIGQQRWNIWVQLLQQKHQHPVTTIKTHPKETCKM